MNRLTVTKESKENVFKAISEPFSFESAEKTGTWFDRSKKKSLSNAALSQLQRIKKRLQTARRDDHL